MRQEQAEYQRQGIAVPTVEFEDNRPCLDLLERKHTGLFALLDEAVSLPRGSDDVFLRNAVAKHADHECFSTNHRNYKASFLHVWSRIVENRSQVSSTVDGA